MNNRRLYEFLKHLTYFSLFLLLFILQRIPGFLSLYGVKPLLLISAAVSFSLCENELISGIYGALAGLFCDIAAGTLFGFFGIFVFLLCVGVSFLPFIFIIKTKTILPIAFLTLFLVGLLYYFFYFSLWRYEVAHLVLLIQILPTVFYSTIFAPLFYKLFNSILKSFNKKMRKN